MTMTKAQVDASIALENDAFRLAKENAALKAKLEASEAAHRTKTETILELLAALKALIEAAPFKYSGMRVQYAMGQAKAAIDKAERAP